MRDTALLTSLRLLDSLLNDVDVQGEDHAGDQARLRAGQLLHQGVDLLTQLLPLLLLWKEETCNPEPLLLTKSVLPLSHASWLHIRRHSRGLGSAHVYSRRNSPC